MKLSIEQVELLLKGLDSLEGAMLALDKNIPIDFYIIKKSLYSEKQRLLINREKKGMSTSDVAETIGCSRRYVLLLAEKGKIRQISSGEKGRGRTGLFDSQSIESYLRSNIR